ncbi:phosphotransferase family protein [Saccharomonospora xinjiangensis]|uniref:phosphotransferase family protein n=1 Tax=Saccharomonospora xinjiangensis TaxID=75294 RepID=UPI00350F4C64
MEHRPEHLPDDSVRAGLARLGIHATELSYAAVGFGDHHWYVTATDGTRWFATVADLENKPHCGDGAAAALAGLRSAMETAVRLRAAGLEFVVAPFGEPVVELGDRYALSVFPVVEGTSGHFGQEMAAGDGVLVQELLARLHTTRVDAPAWSIDPPALRMDGVWSDGPYAEQARRLVDEHESMIRKRFEEFERLAEGVRGAAVVVTHGEPHPGNLIRGAAGFHLVDWDTVGVAVPERDLSVLTDNPAELARYQELTGHEPSADALRLYRLRWHLNDLVEFVDWFREPHTDDPDTVLAWTSFQETLAALGQTTTGVSGCGT